MVNNSDNILVIGSHRSGTTWVGRTIAFHPSVYYIHEPFNINHPNPLLKLELDFWFTHAPTSKQSNNIYTSFNSLVNRSPISQVLLSLTKSKLKIDDFCQFMKKDLVKAFRAKRYLIKDPIALLSAGWIYENFNFKTICLIRNPLGFVGSLKKAGWNFNFKHLLNQPELVKKQLQPFTNEIKEFAYNEKDIIEQAILLWKILHYIVLQYQKKYTSWFFTKHEDLAKDPISGFHTIFDFLNLPLNNNLSSNS